LCKDNSIYETIIGTVRAPQIGTEVVKGELDPNFRHLVLNREKVRILKINFNLGFRVV